MKFEVVPLTLKQANFMVECFHRHHKPAQGHRFSIGMMMETGEVIGAAIVGRPTGRKNPQYDWCEVTRLVTTGERNACSFLYGACARIAKEMGFVKIQTFILDSETGASLRAVGWQFEGISSGGDWNVPSRGGRRTDQPQEAKQRWGRYLK